MNFYSAYGLTIESALPLPDLTSGKGGVDVEICFAPSEPSPPNDPPGVRCLQSAPGSARLAWRNVGEMLVEGGRRIVVTPAPSADEDALRLMVLGAGFGVLLHQRGFLVIHGSAVVIDGQVVGFLGGKGWVNRRPPWRCGNAVIR